MFWVFLPAGVVGIAGYLLISGLRASVIPWRVIAGSILLTAISILAGYLASLSVYPGLGAFIAILPATLAALVVGALMIALLERWRKLASVLVGLVFPLATFTSISVGAYFAPEPPTLEETYRDQVNKLLYDIQHSSVSSDADFSDSYLDRCREYLQDALMQNSNQYSIEDLLVAPPAKYPFGVGSTEARAVVKFPDGREVSLYFYNYTLEDCTLNGER